MKIRLLLSIFFLTAGLCLVSAENQKPLKSCQTRVTSNLKNIALEKFSKKEASSAIITLSQQSVEGTWRFSFGDYFFDDSSMETKIEDLQASFYNDILFFEAPEEDILPMAANFDGATGVLTFNSGQFGDFYNSGILVQLPSIYDPATGQFSVKSFEAQYNEEEGKIIFPENAGIQWWLYDYATTPMFALDIYTIEGAVKVKKTINSLIINKGEEESLQIRFKDFSRIDFKNGNLVFDIAEGLSIPLTNLKTVHFDEYIEEESDGIASIELDSNVKLLYGKDWLAVTGLPASSMLNIFSLNGAKMISVAEYEGQHVDISRLNPGIYVVNSGKYSFKIVK